MNVLILNCDFDESQATNGAVLLRSYLQKKGIVDIVIKEVFNGYFPMKNGLKKFSAVIITGSRASVYENNPWIKKLFDTIKLIDRGNIPTLGICFGFQAIAEALGGKVQASSDLEEGYLPISLTTDGKQHALFKGFPPSFSVYQSHGDILTAFPKDTILLAENTHSSQAYVLRNFYCVQFHPEILPHTAVTMAKRDGKNVDSILRATREEYTLPLQVLSNFISLAAR